MKIRKHKHVMLEEAFFLAALFGVCTSIVMYGLSGGTGSVQALTLVGTTAAIAGALQPFLNFYFGAQR